MKNKCISIIAFFLFLCFGADLHAQYNFRGLEKRGHIVPADTTKKPSPHLEINVKTSLMNEYTRGNLDTWFGEITGDPNRKVDQGASTFFGAEAAIMFPAPNESVQIGAGLGFIIPPDRSLWGTSLFFGGRQELILNPFILSVNLPLRLQMMSQQNVYLDITPNMLMGWVTGTYSDPNTNWSFTPDPGIGFGVAGKMEVFFGKSIGINLELGMRILKTNLVYEDTESTTGYSQPLLNNGDGVQVDLGGTFATAGFTLRI